MYLFYLTLKTPNGIISLCILLYSLILALICPLLRKKGKLALMRILCVLPLIGALIHFCVYGRLTLWAFGTMYIEALIPLLNLLPGRSGVLTAAKSVLSSVLTAVMCCIFLINAIGSPMVHNYSRSSYTKSFTRLLNTIEKEYCLSSWKRIDYDALLADYLPRVEEAEKNNDENGYAAVITEVAYRFYDCHVSAKLSNEVKRAVEPILAGNDYGLSMVRLGDGSVIAVLVEPDHENEDIWLSDEGSELESLGIHNGTQILSWDGQDINEAIDHTECIYTSKQFPVRSNEDIFRPLFLAGKGGESVDITFVDDEGKVHSASIRRIDDYSNRLNTSLVKLLHTEDYSTAYRNNYTCMLDDKCGYLQITRESYDGTGDNIAAVRSGYYPALTEHYAQLIEELKAQGMEYLVIDIRNNGGGYDCCAGALASLFTDEKRHMVSFGYEDSDGYHIKEDQYIFPDGRYKDPPVAVLVNSGCVSAGDGAAKFLADCQNVTLMDITASGGVNQNNGGYIYLTDNICFYYPVFLSLSAEAGPLIDTDCTRENRIPLDVTIPLTKEMALEMFDMKGTFSPDGMFIPEYSDKELDYAVEYLRNMTDA